VGLGTMTDAGMTGTSKSMVVELNLLPALSLNLARLLDPQRLTTMPTSRNHDALPVPPVAYGAEVLCAGWTPVADVQAGPELRSAPEPAAAAPADFESFLARYYRLQQA